MTITAALKTLRRMHEASVASGPRDETLAIEFAIDHLIKENNRAIIRAAVAKDRREGA